MHQGLLDVSSCISAELSALFSDLSTDPSDTGAGSSLSHRCSWWRGVSTCIEQVAEFLPLCSPAVGYWPCCFTFHPLSCLWRFSL